MRRKSTGQARPILHYLFEIGIFVKFFNGILEILGGVLLSFISPASISSIFLPMLARELLENPHDFLAAALLHAAQGLTLTQERAIALYLLLHGAIKVGLVMALWSKRLWAYPVAGVVLSAFTAYQVYLFVQSRSLLLLAILLLDILILLLLRNEYVRIARAKGA